MYSACVLDQTANIKFAVVEDHRRLSEKEKHENQLISLSFRTSQGMIPKDDRLFPSDGEFEIETGALVVFENVTLHNQKKLDFSFFRLN
jgi:hypothetical protein